MLKFIPFDRYELAKLKAYQNCTCLHPYTCPRCKTVLIPTTQGMECPSCNHCRIYYESGSLDLLDEAQEVFKNLLKRNGHSKSSKPKKVKESTSDKD